MTLEEALDRWDVFPPEVWENDEGPKGWFAVANDEGIVAYFGNESDANRYRLFMVNRDLNP